MSTITISKLMHFNVFGKPVTIQKWIYDEDGFDLCKVVALYDNLLTFEINYESRAFTGGELRFASGYSFTVKTCDDRFFECAMQFPGNSSDPKITDMLFVWAGETILHDDNGLTWFKFELFRNEKFYSGTYSSTVDEIVNDIHAMDVLGLNESRWDCRYFDELFEIATKITEFVSSASLWVSAE